VAAPAAAGGVGVYVAVLAAAGAALVERSSPNLAAS
jgi:hypothetical protein